MFLASKEGNVIKWTRAYKPSITAAVSPHKFKKKLTLGYIPAISVVTKPGVFDLRIPPAVFEATKTGF